MAYASSTAELEAIEAVADTVTDALNSASAFMDSRYFVLYETPIVTTDAGLLARLKRWNLALTAHSLTSNRQGATEKVVKDYERAIAELEEVRSGQDRLPVDRLEAPVLARRW